MSNDDLLESAEGLPVAFYHHLKQADKREINSTLAEVTNNSFDWPLAGYEAICEVLSDYGIDLPAVDVNEEEPHEEFVFPLKESGSENPEEPDLDNQNYVYLCYEKNEDGRFEFYAEIVNDDELHNLLDEFDEPEDDEDREQYTD